MREIPNLLLRFKWLTTVFIVFVATYIWLIFQMTPDARTIRQYHITATQLHELNLAVAVPYIVIWLVGLAGFMWLRNYAAVLGESSDGKAFRTISNGVLLLVLWLPLSVLVSGFASHYYALHPAATHHLIRLVNYFNIILLIPAFYYVYQGSRQLLTVAKVKVHGLTQRQSLLFVIFAAFYVFIALSDVSRTVAHHASIATYYLPDWLIVVTIIIPRLVLWFMGFAAVANIILYRRKVKGAIYKEALRSMAVGLTVVVVGIIVLRILQSLSAIVSSWSISVLLAAVYVILLVLGYGYFMLAKGARRLLKIEEL